jgi:hypothetical protein
LHAHLEDVESTPHNAKGEMQDYAYIPAARLKALVEAMRI